MRIELLHIPNCPHTEETALRISSALAALERTDLKVHRKELTSSAEIQGTAFAGSPTIALDGIDLFPTRAPTTDLACRIYQTPDGIAGLPTAGQLHEAIGQYLSS
ncbi:hypothetical protein IWX75_003435 [Arthrobacter sp. CAN_A6]|uniref:thioredoxin family protein n=1 Tax=Arthrobacter sp. CAN_A6 TaxID=2787721 RepID=UPI0018C9A088